MWNIIQLFLRGSAMKIWYWILSNSAVFSVRWAQDLGKNFAMLAISYWHDVKIAVSTPLTLSKLLDTSHKCSQEALYAVILVIIL